MSCETKCPETKKECQDIPLDSFENINLKANIFKNKIEQEKDHELILYRVTSVKVETTNGMFCQTGCGPNLEGGIITLCTCRPDIRAWEKSPSDWKDVWIGGITTKEAKKQEEVLSDYLFYLMKVEDAYESCFDVWNKIGKQVRDLKRADKNPLGDLYAPKNKKLKNEERFCPSNYHEPINNHKHAVDRWKEDINREYGKRIKRRPVYLVGDTENSFVWLDPDKSFRLLEEKAKWPHHKKIAIGDLKTYLDLEG